MKLKFRFLALLCLFFWGEAFSQALHKGDLVPDRQLSAYRGRLVIVDFWATWCAPCRQMMPVMDSLQRAFTGRVQFVSVTYEPERVALPVMDRLARGRTFSFARITGDTALHRLFPHRSLPHYVWIGPSGRVLAFTEEDAVTAAGIRAALSGSGPAAEEKRDTVVAYRTDRPLFSEGNGGTGSQLRYHSVLAGFLPGVPGGVSISPYDSVRGQLFTVRNAPFPWLCRLAFGEGGRVFPRSRTMIISRDSDRMDSPLGGQAYERWLAAGNGWSYELLLPPGRTGQAFQVMQEDLRRLFPQYTISVERRVVPSLALVRLDSTDRLASRGGALAVDIGPYSARLVNAHLSQLMMRLERQYLQNSTVPVTDMTGYAGRVDLELKAELWNVVSLNAALKPYGLALERRPAPAEILVIRDR